MKRPLKNTSIEDNELPRKKNCNQNHNYEGKNKIKRPFIHTSNEDDERPRKKICNLNHSGESINKMKRPQRFGEDNECPRKRFCQKNDYIENDHMDRKKYEFVRVCGIKRNSKCIYVPKQKLIYVQNVKNKAGQKTYICYNYKNQKCLARVMEIKENICQPTLRSKQHTCTINHENFVLNCLLLRNIKNRALEVNRISGTEAFKISSKAIMDQEKSK